VTIVDSDAAERALAHDYLGRLHAAAWGLPAQRRDELVAEVREHIDEALRSERAAGRSGEVVVRNVLERLGPPEEIVRAESEGQPYDAGGAAPQSADSWWGPVEILAVVLLSVGGVVLPVMGPIIGLVLLWVSPRWTRGQKAIGTALSLLPALLLFVIFARPAFV
jgi:uncharacterized membrane protein